MNIRTGITRGLYLVALVFLILSFSSFMDLLLGANPCKLDKRLVRTLSRQRGPETSQVDRESYASIASGVFLGTVPQQPRTARRGRYTPPRSGPLFLLRGTMIHTDPARSCAFIEVRGEREQKTVYIGDQIQGAKVSAITGEAVELIKGGQTIRLEVSFEDLQPKGFAAAQPSQPGATGAVGDAPSTIADLLKRYPQVKPVWEAANQRERAMVQRALKLPPERRTKLIRNILQRVAKRMQKTSNAKARRQNPNRRTKPAAKKKATPQPDTPKNRLRF